MAYFSRAFRIQCTYKFGLYNHKLQLPATRLVDIEPSFDTKHRKLILSSGDSNYNSDWKRIAKIMVHSKV